MRDAHVRPRWQAAAVFTLATSLGLGCLGTNEREDELTVQLARYEDKGRKAIDPIVTPGFLSLTFDDGPAEGTTRHIIDVLAEHRIQATFFCVGKLIPAHRDILDKMKAAGQQVASHSYNHEPQPSLTEEIFKHRVSAVKENIGDHDNGRLLFRFPFGAAGDNQLRWLAEVDIGGKRYRPVGWHADSQDFDYDLTYPEREFSTRILEDENVLDEGKCDGQESPFVTDFVGWTQFIARKTKGGVMLFHDTKRITSDKIEQIVEGFESAERYWSSLPPEKAAAYKKYYACEKVDPFFRFEFQTLWGGAWPSLRD
jgi:peptidoglycan/xylan/chitin deacetylase (PgdA/CDA1 family)